MRTRLAYLAALILPAAAVASGNGIIGYSGRGVATCSSCHSAAASAPAPTVTIVGPSSIAVGTTASYELVLSGGPGVRGGMNVSVDDPDAALFGVAGSTKVSADEVTHESPKAFSGGQLRFQFRLSAPGAAGVVKLFGAGNSCDGAGVNGDKDGKATLSVTVVSSSPNPPTVATAASAASANVTSTSTTVSVLGADDSGEASLSYSWAMKSGPAPVTFAANGTNAAKNSTATFSRAGAYVLEVTIKDPLNQAVTSQVSVNVAQSLSQLQLSPAAVTVPAGGTAQFSAKAVDQFGAQLAMPTPVAWSAAGGTIDSSGLFTAGTTAGGPFTVTASASGKSGTATVTVSAGAAPTVATAPAAAPATVTSTTAQLSVLGADDGGEAQLTYAWSVTSGPAAVSFGANFTNAAKSTVATFAQAGSYVLAVQIKDATGQLISATVPVTVSQTLAGLSLSPQSAGIAPNGTQQFSLRAVDQFAAQMTAPAATWTVSGGGTVSSSGLLTAAATAGGPYTVRAAAGAQSAIANFNVVAGSAPVITQPATATLDSTAEIAATLKVLAADDSGEPSLLYTWAMVQGPADVTFSPNASNAAKTSRVSFTRAGDYTFSVQIKDAAQLTASGSVTVTVPVTITTVQVSPAAITVPANGSQQFAATAKDQFGQLIFPSPAVIWSTTGGGNITSAGLYRAGGATGGPYEVKASAAGKSGVAAVSIGSGQAPTIATAATATPATVMGRSTTLRVLGLDDASEGALRYLWSSQGPAAVVFSSNDSNAAKDTIATFASAGDYELTATVTDADGMSVMSSARVVVSAELATITLSPPLVELGAGESVAFRAAVLDQFGAEQLLPAGVSFTASGGGEIDQSGVFTAGSVAGGPFTVSASNGALRATSRVTVLAAAVEELAPPDDASTDMGADGEVRGSTNLKDVQLGCSMSGSTPLGPLALLCVLALQLLAKRRSSMLRAMAVFAALALPAASWAQDGGTYFNERCARRVSSALLGQSPTSALLTSSNPQSQVDAMLAPAPLNSDGTYATTAFQEKFSRYINSQFNPEPGLQTAEDASYWLVRHILQRNLPWRDVFVGPYRVVPGEDDDDPSTVVTDTAGLGYFRSRQWMVRYAGNEAAGYRLVAAYRMMHNVLGLRLTAAQNTDGVDASTRQTNSACSGCHFDPVFGLDLAARVLSKRKGTGTSMTFTAPTEGPQTFLGGQSISDDKTFVTAMVSSPDFRFRACRIAFEFLYGRPEYKCEGAVFDRCVAAFTSTGKITDAIATVAKDPSFCQ